MGKGVDTLMKETKQLLYPSLLSGLFKFKPQQAMAQQQVFA